MYRLRIPAEEFAELRGTAPVWWNPQPKGIAGFGDDGYWVVSKHAEVKEVSLDSERFSAAENTAIIRFSEDMTRDRIEAQRLILLNTDPPHHTKLRGIVSRGFTPRAINSLRDTLAARAERIVQQAKENGSGDFVTQVACELPLQAIAELLGLPQDDPHKVLDLTNHIVSSGEPCFAI